MNAPTRHLPCDYEAIAWHQVKRIIPLDIRVRLSKEDWLEDLRQTVRFAAWKAKQDGLDLGESSRFAQREVYAFMVALGWRRKRGGGWMRATSPVPLHAVQEEERTAAELVTEHLRGQLRDLIAIQCSLPGTWREAMAWARSKTENPPVKLGRMLRAIGVVVEREG